MGKPTRGRILGRSDYQGDRMNPFAQITRNVALSELPYVLYALREAGCEALNYENIRELGLRLIQYDYAGHRFGLNPKASLGATTCFSKAIREKMRKEVLRLTTGDESIVEVGVAPPCRYGVRSCLTFKGDGWWVRVTPARSWTVIPTRSDNRFRIELHCTRKRTAQALKKELLRRLEKL